jgi:sphingolipid 4-desaturase/C4-monooxygenase
MSLTKTATQTTTCKAPATSTNASTTRSTQMPTHFAVSSQKEPHAARRKAILAQHPEISSLAGPDLRLLPCMLLLCLAQVSLAVYATRLSWPVWFVVSYTMGGTLTHWLSLGNHELSHNLCFKKPLHNTMLGMLANMAQGIPSFTNFCKYHLEHHYHQGSRGKDYIDVDIPSDWETRVFTTRPRKVLWVFLQPLFYGIRPLWMNPKPHTLMDTINMATTLAFDGCLAYHYGIRAVLFNVVSTLLGMGLHPVAGHFIAEHYTLMSGGQETYSYYGPLNWCAFNVGYHNEHHDFPRISGFSLPRVTEMAPEFYEPLASYTSWTKVIYDYIMRPDIGPCSRVIRE